MATVRLFRLERDDLRVSIDLSLDQSGRLVLEGYDVGSSIERVWGDSDYEYGFTVNLAAVNVIYDLMKVERGNQVQLLNEMNNRFGGNEAYSSICKFLESNNVPFTGSNWT